MNDVWGLESIRPPAALAAAIATVEAESKRRAGVAGARIDIIVQINEQERRRATLVAEAAPLKSRLLADEVLRQRGIDPRLTTSEQDAASARLSESERQIGVIDAALPGLRAALAALDRQRGGETDDRYIAALAVAQPHIDTFRKHLWSECIADVDRIPITRWTTKWSAIWVAAKHGGMLIQFRENVVKFSEAPGGYVITLGNYHRGPGDNVNLISVGKDVPELTAYCGEIQPIFAIAYAASRARMQIGVRRNYEAQDRMLAEQDRHMKLGSKGTKVTLPPPPPAQPDPAERTEPPPGYDPAEPLPGEGVRLTLDSPAAPAAGQVLVDENALAARLFGGDVARLRNVRAAHRDFPTDFRGEFGGAPAFDPAQVATFLAARGIDPHGNATT